MIKLLRTTSQFSLVIKKKFPKISRNQTRTIDMGTQPGSSKRPTCPTCSKPVRTCLCTRLQAPRLNNSVKITVLQHSLEQKHPLNSTRIATLGLQNIELFTVSDVNFTAHFLIRLLESGGEMGRTGFHEENNVFDEMSGRGDRNSGGISGVTTEMHEICKIDENPTSHSFCDLGTGKYSEEAASRRGRLGSNHLDEKGVMIIDGKVEKMYNSEENIISRNIEAASLAFNIGKYGNITSVPTMPHESLKTSFDQLWMSLFADKSATNGFVVKKIPTSMLEGSKESVESEEFKINVSPGSVLLFPSENSVSIEDVDFVVKNMIVLDGTWDKAKRMYCENPWLRFLPHVRLDLRKSSLYSEVRHQPKAGYLSTIESIVYALKAVGEEDYEGLNSLLDVFESMVEDQRQCKNERLSKT